MVAHGGGSPPLTQFLIGRENGSEGGSMEHEGFSPSGGKEEETKTDSQRK